MPSRLQQLCSIIGAESRTYGEAAGARALLWPIIALRVAHKTQLCPDARLREEMLEGNIEDIPVGAMSPRLAQQVSEIEVDRTINVEAIAKAVGRTPLDLTVLMSRSTSNSPLFDSQLIEFL